MSVMPSVDIAAAGPSASPPPSRWRALGLALLAAIYLLIAHVLPRPEAISPAGWRINAIFFATIAGLMLRPVPGGVVVLLGITLLLLVGQVPMSQALSGFSAGSVWLVLAAMLMSRALRTTGLARRLALVFVRRFGGSSLGVSYSLMMADATLAAGIPSITARSGSIILPITRSIAELFASRPGDSAGRLGRFLMTALYQSSVVVCAMFLTGQASNVLAANLAAELAGVTITWSRWFIAAIVPGALSCLAIPWLVHRLLPPAVRRTPEAAAFARTELTGMGPMSRPERITAAVFVGAVLLWMSSQWHEAVLGFTLDVTVVALLGLAILLLTDVLPWSEALAERSAWDVFIWYGGLLTLSEALNRTGSITALAGWLGGWFGDWPWMAVLLVAIGIYFYAHYVFASITAHILAMMPPFLLLVVGAGAPPTLAAFALACLANLTAGLTHYGTTTGPMVFAEGYVSHRDWWRAGFLASLANLAVWLVIGLAWWKVLRFW